MCSQNYANHFANYEQSIQSAKIVPKIICEAAYNCGYKLDEGSQLNVSNLEKFFLLLTFS